MFDKAITLFANATMLLAARKGYQDWKKATQDVESVQRRVLFQTLKRSAETSFGKAHRFCDIATTRDYQRSVPVRSYEEFEPWIQRAAKGEQRVLTAEPILMFEPSSGSTSASKLIPYSKALKREFQQGIDPWVYSLLTSYPKLLKTKQYWSITPVVNEKSYTTGGIPIGFEEDSEYFGGIKTKLVQAVMAVPSTVRNIQDLEVLRYATLRFLLECRDLGLISVWNPTFLLLLLEKLPDWMPQLIDEISAGGQKKRAKELSGIWETRYEKQNLYKAIWPNLTLISCWADAFAKEYADRLQQLFPNTLIQPKGLLATEAFVSFPVRNLEGAALSVNSHFFEFIGENGINLAHELEKGAQYSVVVTTSGGLYRYHLKDQIEVTGFLGTCPLVRFIGKGDAVVDLFGEKLNEVHIRGLVENELKAYQLQPAFWILAPEKDCENSAHYTLFLQLNERENIGHCKEAPYRLGESLEKNLQANHH